MTPQQILPAIPRQKVKTEQGEIYEVLGYNTRMGYILVDSEKYGVEYLYIDKCEPVPEEPRGFKVGDKVFAKYTSRFGTIQTVRAPIDGWPEGYSLSGDYFYAPEAIRHCSKEEEARYFNK